MCIGGCCRWICGFGRFIFLPPLNCWVVGVRLPIDDSFVIFIRFRCRVIWFASTTTTSAAITSAATTALASTTTASSSLGLGFKELVFVLLNALFVLWLGTGAEAMADLSTVEAWTLCRIGRCSGSLKNALVDLLDFSCPSKVGRGECRIIALCLFQDVFVGAKSCVAERN